jgi:hypothetical protein
MTSDESKLEILKKVEDGTLSVEEGADLLEILEHARSGGQQQEVVDPIPPMEHPAEAERVQASGCWKAAWSMVLTGGAVLTAFSGFWMYQGYQKGGLGWGFWLSWIPLLIGALVTIFGVILMESPWMHIRIKSSGEKKPADFTISIPAPLKLVSWVFSTFGQYMPQEIKDKGVEEVIGEVERSLERGEPFQIEVEDKDDGDEVYVSISK